MKGTEIWDKIRYSNLDTGTTIKLRDLYLTIEGLGGNEVEREALFDLMGIVVDQAEQLRRVEGKVGNLYGVGRMLRDEFED